MLHLIPAPLHRALYRAAHRARRLWWRVRRPHLTGCTAVVRNPAGEILLVRHSYGSPRWGLPGGGVKRGEDPAATIVRELAEETGCRIEAVTAIGVIEQCYYGMVNTVHLFIAQTRDEPRADLRELTAARFFAAAALPAVLSPRARRQLGSWITEAAAANPPPPRPLAD